MNHRRIMKVLFLAGCLVLIVLGAGRGFGQAQEEDSRGGFWGRSWNRGSRFSMRQGPGFINAKMLMVEFEVDPKTLRAVLPAPLEPGSKSHGFAFIAHYPKTRFGSIYYEGAVFLWARYKEHEGWHCLAMPVDDEVAMIGGRRIGFPKKMSEITLKEKGNKMTGRVMFEGKVLMAIEATLDKEGVAPNILMGGPLMNLVPLSAHDKPGGYAANAVLLKAVSGVRVHKVRGGTAKLSLNISETYPLPDLQVLKILDVFYVEQDVGGGPRASVEVIRFDP